MIVSSEIRYALRADALKMALLRELEGVGHWRVHLLDRSAHEKVPNGQLKYWQTRWKAHWQAYWKVQWLDCSPHGKVPDGHLRCWQNHW